MDSHLPGTSRGRATRVKPRSSRADSRGMSSTPRIRVLGLVVGLAVLALVAGFFLLSRGQPSSSAATPHTVVPLSQRTKAPVKHVAKVPAARKPAVRKPAAPKPV